MYQADIDDVVLLLDMIVGSTVAYSLLSFFTRAERTLYLEEFSKWRFTYTDV